MTQPMLRVVPFRRQLRRGIRGKDVQGLKRALARAGYLKWEPQLFTQLYGPYTVRAVKNFQKDNKLPVTGIYDKDTHSRLSAYYDALGASYMGAIPKPGVSTVRNRIINAATVLRNRREVVRYSQIRRMQIVKRKMNMRDIATAAAISEDCSSSATGCYYIAGAPDPNGRNYDGHGYTGTLAQHGKPVSLRSAKPGDLVLYGDKPPYKHVAIYLGKKLVWSHGSDGGPYAPVPVDYRKDRALIKNYLGD